MLFSFPPHPPSFRRPSDITLTTHGGGQDLHFENTVSAYFLTYLRYISHQSTQELTRFATQFSVKCFFYYHVSEWYKSRV